MSRDDLPRSDGSSLQREDAEPRGPAARLYVWGYGLPTTRAIQEEFQETVDARCIARERGWDGFRPGSWAREWSGPLTLPQAIRWMYVLVESEAAATGWEVCGEHAPA